MYWGYVVIKYGRIMAMFTLAKPILRFPRQMGYIRAKSLIINEKYGYTLRASESYE